MKTLFYSTRDFEKKYLTNANNTAHDIVYSMEPLTLATVQIANGFDAIVIFTSDDASAEVLKALQLIGIQYIAIRATGHDNIDIQVANLLGIKIANVPNYSPYAIAEHAVALLLALARKINISSKQMQQYNFTIDNLVGFNMHGKTVGIIGVGKIGGIFAKIMHGFGCTILGCDIVENKDLTTLYGLQYVNLKTLCAKCNIISIHTGLTPDTKYLINTSCINLMQQGTILINTGRGACVNTTDVITGLENGKLGYYAADVYEYEKGVFFNDFSNTTIKDEMLLKLLSMPNVIITPHQAFATQEALTDIANSIFYTLDCWSKNETSKNELSKIIIDDVIAGNGNN